jgi:hypothetical protein
MLAPTTLIAGFMVSGVAGLHLPLLKVFLWRAPAAVASVPVLVSIRHAGSHTMLQGGAREVGLVACQSDPKPREGCCGRNLRKRGQ